jgi:four helix bundle protein
MPAGFEKLRIWQEAHQLILEIHEIAKSLPFEERYRKRDQIERSSSAAPDNIAEGYCSYYYNDKIKGFYIARKEAGETQNHFRALEGKKYITKEKADSFIERYEKLIQGINGYINYIRKRRGSDR